MALIGQVFATLRARLRTLAGGAAADIAATLRDRIAAEGGLPMTPRQRGGWDRAMDSLNRLPRPLMALGTLGLIAAALIAPDWFAARMEALAAMPEALWWLIGAIISLFFGARMQAKDQDFARELLSGAGDVAEPLANATTGTDADLTLLAEAPGANAALAEWQAA